MIQWGAVDYSLSMGRPGARNTPEVKAVERQVFEMALKMGVPPRAEIHSLDQAKYYLDLGVRHFCLGTDITILYNWLKENGESLRRALSGS
jgi:4-hydroxy-2-oxoheptanedioate aldolase